jgi:glycosyltransferase involved in cell wall biosynthesis
LLRQLNSEPRNQDSFFKITFTGSLYNEHNVSVFIEGIERFVNENESTLLKVVFVGIDLKPSDNVRLVNKFQLKHPDIVEIIDAVSHSDSIRYQLASSLLLKFDYTGQYQGLLGAKLYEYAATKKPILTVLSIENKETTFYPNRSIQYMVNSPDEIVKVVKSLYEKHEQGELVESDLSEEEILSFSREYKIRELAEIINKSTLK